MKSPSKIFFSKPTQYFVAIAEYDECGSDGLAINAVEPFTDSAAAAKFITDDYNETIDGLDEMDEEVEKLKLTAVKKSINKLKPGESHYWYTPDCTPSTIQWKIFAK